MPLPQPEATTLRRWSRRRSKLFSSLALAGVLTIGGCGIASDDAEPQEAASADTSQGFSEPEPEPVDVIDDNRSVEARIRDATVEANIRLALVDERSLRPFDFEPMVENGRVTLRGEVRTQDQRRRAATVAEGVSGVSEVVNELDATEEPAPADEALAGDTLAGDTSKATKETSGDRTASRDTAAERSGEEASAADDGSDDATAQSEEYHTVRSGESLWQIANRNGVSVDQIKRLNNLQSNSIKPGQRLRIR